MAAIEELGQEISYLTPKISLETAKGLLAQIVWLLFDKTKHESYKFKVKVFGITIPVSIKIEKLEPVIKRWVGVRPFPK